MPLLTPAQFAKTAAAKKPGASYDRYTAYATNMPKKRAAKRQRLAAEAAGSGLSDEQAFADQWKQIAGMFGGIDPSFNARSDAEISRLAGSDVASIIDPQIARITERISGQARQGHDAITKAYGGLAESAKDVAGNVRQDYGQAEGDLAATTGALGEFLKGRGASAFADLSGKLGDAGLPQDAVQDAAGGAQGLAAGAAGEAAGRGFSGLTRTIGERAANLGYADKLPGLAALSGADLGRTHEAGMRELLDNSLGDITAQIPGLTSELARGYRGDEITKAGQRSGHKSGLAQLASAFLQGTLNRDASTKIADAARNLDASQFNQTLGQRRYEFGETQKDADLDRNADITAERQDAAKRARANRASAIEDARSGTAQLATSAYTERQEPVMLTGTSGKQVPHPTKTRTVREPLPYAEAFRRAWSLYAPSLKARYALKDTEIRSVINEGLVAAGITPPSAPAPSATQTSRR